LDYWVGTLLGDPQLTVCSVTIDEQGDTEDSDDEEEDTGDTSSPTVSLANLSLSPLDVLALSGSDGEAMGSELKHRILHALDPGLTDGSTEATVSITFDRFDGMSPDQRSFDETLELARAIRRVITNGRAATARDLALAEEGEHSNVEAYTGDLGTRTRALHDDLTEYGDALTILLDVLTGESTVVSGVDAPVNGTQEPTSVFGLSCLEMLAEVLDSVPDLHLDELSGAFSGVAARTFLTDLTALQGLVADLAQMRRADDVPVGTVRDLLTAQPIDDLERFDEVDRIDTDAIEETLTTIDDILDDKSLDEIRSLISPSKKLLGEEALSVAGGALDDIEMFLRLMDSDLSQRFADVRPLVDALVEMAETRALLALREDPSEERWRSLDLDAVRSELDVLRNAAGRQGTHFATAVETTEELSNSIDQLADARVGNTVEPLRQALHVELERRLWRLSYYGLHGTTTAPNETREEQVSRAQSVVEEAQRRVVDAAPNTRGDVSNYRDALQAMFGEEFVVLPSFRPSNREELASTFDPSHGEQLLDGDPLAVETWLHRAARIRERPAAFQRVYTYAEALDGGLLRGLRVGQLPFTGDPNERWVGLENEAAGPRNGRISLVAQFATPLPNEGPLVGLFIDEWVETIPERTTTTGLSFHYDTPGHRAPQAALVGVPPDEAGWTMDTLAAITREAFDLARLRMVDFGGDELDDRSSSLYLFDRLLPALCFLGLTSADDPPITVDLTRLLMEESDE
jgi:hypothetical protein